MSTNRSDYRTLPRRAALCAVVAVAAAVAMFSSRELPAQPAPAPGPGAARNAAPPPGAARNPTPAPAVTPPPASAPTSQPRYELAPPPGFVKIVVGDRMAVADKADEAWVREALTQLSPATRPSTMPSDLATNLNNKRADLVNTIAADFGVKDVAAIQRSIDAHVVPMLRQMQSFKAAIYYMPTTRQKLLAAVKGGWDNPQFHYNRAADDVNVNTNIQLSTDHPMDDWTIPVVYDDATPPAQRKEILTGQMRQVEAGLLGRMSERSQLNLLNEFVRVIDEVALKPLELKPGQEWFTLGVQGVFSAKYLSMISGLPQDKLIELMSAPDSRNPMRPQTIDLLHLTPPAQLNPQYVGAYIDAARRKSVSTVNDWLKQAGPGALAKTIAAIQQTKPADGEALVKVIKDATGVDLSGVVRPQ